MGLGLKTGTIVSKKEKIKLKKKANPFSEFPSQR
jgi:hypothetical protein